MIVGGAEERARGELGVGLDGDESVDCAGKALLPGLFDVHVHLTSIAGQPWYQRITPRYSEAYAATTGLRNALVMARAGFTTVRDLGSGPESGGGTVGPSANGGDSFTVMVRWVSQKNPVRLTPTSRAQSSAV